MPKSNIYFGYALIVIGVLLLLFTFYLGFGFYKTVFTSAISPSSSQISNSTIAGGEILGIIAGFNIRGFLLFTIAIIVLLVMIGIGGRLVKYGISMLSIVETDEEESKERRERRVKAEKS